MTDSTPTASSSDPVDADVLLGAYDTQAEWLRFADAKAGAVLTANGVVIGLLVPHLSELLAGVRGAGAAIMAVPLLFFALWLFYAAASAVRAFRCILPFRQDGQHPAEVTCPHFHSVGIAKQYRIDETQRFIEDSRNTDEAGYRDQILAATLIDAHISSRKYGHVMASIRALGISAVFAFLYLLAFQGVSFYFEVTAG
ncbi:MAG: hypothetical protein AAFN74_15800 [Myxococcota bacterium]